MSNEPCAVTRRSFLATLGATAATLVVPGLIVRRELDMHRLVAEWCDEPDGISRYDLSSPFVRGSHAYGTDARGLLEISTCEADTDQTERRLPNILEPFDVFWHEQRGWKKLPPEVLLRNGNGYCPECRENTPDEDDPCPDCGGWGRSSTGRPCRMCRATGQWFNVDCPTCHGFPDGDWPWLVQFGEQTIDVRYFRRMTRVPGVMWQAGRAQIGQPPILFRSDIGVRGMVMPVLGWSKT